MVCLGIEPWAARWKAQTNQLSRLILYLVKHSLGVVDHFVEWVIKSSLSGFNCILLSTNYSAKVNTNLLDFQWNK